MEPKEKAKELIYRFYSKIGFYPQAKDCALECVEEVIESLNKNRGYTQCVIDLEFWEKVKIEIKK